MQLTVTLWRGKYTRDYWWQIPGRPAQCASDLGTAAKEAMEHVTLLHPNIAHVSFTLS